MHLCRIRRGGVSMSARARVITIIGPSLDDRGFLHALGPMPARTASVCFAIISSSSVGMT